MGDSVATINLCRKGEKSRCVYNSEKSTHARKHNRPGTSLVAIFWVSSYEPIKKEKSAPPFIFQEKIIFQN